MLCKIGTWRSVSFCAPEHEKQMYSVTISSNINTIVVVIVIQDSRRFIYRSNSINSISFILAYIYIYTDL